MKFYCGIDLSARDSSLCVIDESLSIKLRQKARNELPRIIDLLKPFKPNIHIVVETAFNFDGPPLLAVRPLSRISSPMIIRSSSVFDQADAAAGLEPNLSPAQLEAAG